MGVSLYTVRPIWHPRKGTRTARSDLYEGEADDLDGGRQGTSKRGLRERRGSVDRELLKERRPSFLGWVCWLYPCFLRGLWQASLDGGASRLRILEGSVWTSRGASPLYRSLLCVLRHELGRLYSNLTAYRCMGTWDFFAIENSAPGVPARATRGGRSRSIGGPLRLYPCG